MDEFSDYARLKPAATPLAAADRAALRRTLFGADGHPTRSVAARDVSLLRLDRARQLPSHRRRAVLGAAACVAVVGVLGVALAAGGGADVVPSAQPTAPRASAASVVPRPPLVLLDEPGWSLAVVYDVPGGYGNVDRGVVLAPAGTFPHGRWASVTAVAGTGPSAATVPPWPDSSTVDIGSTEIAVSRMDRLTSATWRTADGASFTLDGWDLTEDDVPAVAAGLAFDGLGVIATGAPAGWEVVSPALVAAFEHATENTFADGTPSVSVSTLATAGDAPMLAGRTLTTRFYYGGESALRRRVAPGEGVRRVVAGEELVVAAEGATFVRIHVIRGDWTWEVDVQDAVSVTTDEALALFARLREVDDDTWEAALPPGTVTPASRPGVVAEMLAGVPVPEGFDVAAIAGVHATTSRSTVAAEVALGAACAWAAERAAAIESADPRRQRAAAEAVASVASWPLLAEAAPGDGWDDALRDGGPECPEERTT